MKTGPVSQRQPRVLAAAAAIVLMFAPSFVTAQEGRYKVGDRVECDPSQIGSFRKGTVVPYAKSDFNPAGIAGRYYRVVMDGTSDTEGYVCIATHMRPLAEAAAPRSQGAGEFRGRSNAGAPTDNRQSGQPVQPARANNYGARDRRTCADTKAPARGAITADAARQYFICQAEMISGYDLYLVENVGAVEVGSGRPYNPNSDINYSELDVTVPIYPIRGSFTKYICAKVYSEPGSLYNVGKNCSSFENPKAKGSCYKTTFGDWKCSMFDLNPNRADDRNSIAPPM